MRYPRLTYALLRTAVLASALALWASCGSRTELTGSEADKAVNPSAGGTGSATGGGGHNAGGKGHGGGGNTADCEPQDAYAAGQCATVLPGVVFDGQHCVGLGSGCGCQGDDCQQVYDSVHACVADRMGCYEVNCQPTAVADDSCLDCDQSVYLGAFYNGRDCFELHGCACAGEGCERQFVSVAECDAVHAGCPANRCLATGGIYFPANAGFCGFQCGYPAPEICGQPIASCACPAGMTATPDGNCLADPACEEEDLCFATHGSWHPAAECYCGFFCGQPQPCDGCVDSCDCGPHRNFVLGQGCQLDPSCPAASQQAICEATSGNWLDCNPPGSPCTSHPFCGVSNGGPFPTGGCNCGILGNFDEARGCVWDGSCVLGPAGQTCLGGSNSPQCRPGLACCNMCGTAPGCPVCVNPCCVTNSTCYEGCDNSIP